LCYLNLLENKLGNKSAKCIAKGLHTNKTIDKLNLKANNIGDEGAINLTYSLKDRQMRSFILSANYISSSTVTKIKKQLSLVNFLDIENQHSHSNVEIRSISNPPKRALTSQNMAKKSVESGTSIHVRTLSAGSSPAKLIANKDSKVIQLLKLHLTIQALENDKSRADNELTEIQQKILDVTMEREKGRKSRILKQKTQKLTEMEKESCQLHEELAIANTDLLDLQIALGSALSTIKNLQTQLYIIKNKN